MPNPISYDDLFDLSRKGEIDQMVKTLKEVAKSVKSLKTEIQALSPHVKEDQQQLIQLSEKAKTLNTVYKDLGKKVRKILSRNFHGWVFRKPN